MLRSNVLWALLGLCSCGGSVAAESSREDAAVEASTGGTIESACAEQVAARCRDFEKCASQIELWQFASEEDCRANGLRECTERARLPGVTKPFEKIDRCTATLGCGNSLRARGCLRPDPSITGTRADGAGCIEHAQCASGYCENSGIPLVHQCGQCRRFPKAGDACAMPGPCGTDTGLFCSADNVCVVPAPGTRGEGETCGPDAGCAPEFVCKGVCERPRATTFALPGEACSGELSEPFCRGEHHCVRRVCVPIVLDACVPGEVSIPQCGWYRVCSRSAGTAGTCIPLADACP